MMYRNNFVAVVKCDGRVLRERHGSKVYLPYGSQYSILLKNKDARNALVEVEVDGENVLDGHKLILRGNEEQEIKGFMRSMSKTNRFKFINKTKEIQKHRGDRVDDGLIRITYRFEKQIEQPVYIEYWRPNWPQPRYDSDDSSGSGDFYYFSSDSKTYGDFRLSGATSGRSYKKSSGTVSCSMNSFAPLADEGITVKGAKINQDYQYGNIGQLEAKTHTIILQLLGATKNKKRVNKPLTVKSKATCTTCGRKNKYTNNFCYNCGTYLD